MIEELVKKLDFLEEKLESVGVQVRVVGEHTRYYRGHVLLATAYHDRPVWHAHTPSREMANLMSKHARLVPDILALS